MTKRTTVILDDDDQASLQQVAELMKTNSTEAIRKSIRIAEMLLLWESTGGEIIVGIGNDQFKVVFV
jgi:hypothetical protein